MSPGLIGIECKGLLRRLLRFLGTLFVIHESVTRTEGVRSRQPCPGPGVVRVNLECLLVELDRLRQRLLRIAHGHVVGLKDQVVRFHVADVVRLGLAQ